MSKIGILENIVGNKIQLEPLQIDHYELLYDAANNERIWSYMPTRADGEFFDSWFQDCLIKHKNNTQITYVIRILTEDAIIGSVSYCDIDLIHKRLEISYGWLTPTVWGNKLLQEFLWLMFKNAFETWQFNRIQLGTDPRNNYSYNVLKKIGVKEEGLLRQHMIHHNGLITDTVVFSLLASEWPEIKNSLWDRINKK